MKKRILLSLVSFFAMTAMWASLIDAYQIYLTAGAPGKTNATAELTLNMKNRNAIGSWNCTLELPAGVTFVSVAKVDARYPEGYEAELVGATNADGTVTISCNGAEGVALTGTDGAVAVLTVKIDASVEPGDYPVNVKLCRLEELNGTIHDNVDKEITWTIEKGEDTIPGDLNGDGKVDIADAVAVLGAMTGELDLKYDVNGDGNVDIADFVSVLQLMI